MDLRNRKLYRARHDRRLAGVCGGLGEYFQVDSTLLRLLWVLLLFPTGVIGGVLFYVVAWVIVPEEPAYSGAVETVADPQP